MAGRILLLSDCEGGQSEDAILAAEFESQGFQTNIVDWKALGSVIDRVDAAIVRTTWDYTTQVERFLSFLKTLSARTNLFNPFELIEWNWHKRYLVELLNAGVAVVPSLVLAEQGHGAVEAGCERLGGAEFVLKRAVGAGGRGMLRFKLQDLHSQDFSPAFSTGSSAILQPFMPAIQSAGEWALVYFEEELVLSVHKEAAPGEYLIQRQYGGKETIASPPDEVMALALQVLKLLPVKPLFARLDILGGATPAIMEVEVIEPRLYFDAFPQFAPQFVRAVLQRL